MERRSISPPFFVTLDCSRIRYAEDKGGRERNRKEWEGKDGGECKSDSNSAGASFSGSMGVRES